MGGGGVRGVREGKIRAEGTHKLLVVCVPDKTKLVVRWWSPRPRVRVASRTAASVLGVALDALMQARVCSLSHCGSS